MLVWGGSGTADGAAYDPGTDTWSPITATGAPSARSDHFAAWSGTEMIVWGGGAGGGRYAPGVGWSPLPWPCEADPSDAHYAVWTGDGILVWSQNSRGMLRPVTGTTWSRINAPSGSLSGVIGRRRHTAVWTGTEMLVWGGIDSGGSSTPFGGHFTPSVAHPYVRGDSSLARARHASAS